MPVITRAQAKRHFSQTCAEQSPKRAKIQGRSVDIAPARSSIGWRLLTITGICLLALGLMFVPVAMASPSKCIGEQCHQIVPYSQINQTPNLSPLALTYEGMRQCTPAKPCFSKNLAQYMIKGYRLTPDGRAACRLKDPPESHQHCLEIVEEEQFFMDLTLEILGFKASEMPDYNEKGSKGFYEGIKLEMNPQRMRNFQKALNCAEKNIIQDSRFFEKSDDEILDVVKEIHKTAMKDILPQDRAGIFRTDILIVAADRDSSDVSSIVKSAYRKIMKIGTADEVALFKSSLLKLQEDFFDGIRNFTKEERRVWDKLIIISPMPETVELEMRHFVQQLKRHHQEGMTATQLACFAHNEIGRIHAFEDGNGRLSFILLNAFLKRAGVPEVVFPCENEYTRKVMEEIQNPGALCRYLEEQMIPWTNAHREVLELDDAV